jgi:glycosyltransferase involved in cell wall biosynthesis
MKVLQCHNLYQLPGGEDRVVEDERALLEAHGHEVVTHTLSNDAVDELSRARLAAGTVWSRASAKRLRGLVRQHRPDIAHFHNTLPLMSPSAYYAVRGEGVPVVQTLHNYRLLCPKATFFRDNRICEDCLHKRVKWPAVKHGCYRDSKPASAAIAAMLTIHGSIGTYRQQVDAYIACSEFTRQKMIEGGYPGKLIHYKPNFVPQDPGVGRGDGGYALYLGRLVQDKGLEVLAEAWDRLGPRPLRVVGKGPLETVVGRLAERRADVVHESWAAADRLTALMHGAAFLILPTLNYEGFPKVIVEAYAHGLPVVATDVGAMSRVVVEGVTGRHVRYGDATDVARVVEELFNDPQQLRRLRRGAREAYETQYSTETNYDRLTEVYRTATQRYRRETGHRRRPDSPTAPA